MDLFVGNIVR